MTFGKHFFTLSDEAVNKIESIVFKLNLLASNQCEQKNKLLCSAILLILQNYLFNRVTPYAEPTQQSDESWVQQFFALIENMDFPTYSVNDLCSKLGYSRMQLNRLFKIRFNKTPHEYLTEYKLRYAKNLLKNTDMRVIDIAFSLGYSSASQFQSIFKQKYKLTPNTFRKQNRRVTQPEE